MPAKTRKPKVIYLGRGVLGVNGWELWLLSIRDRHYCKNICNSRVARGKVGTLQFIPDPPKTKRGTR